MSDELRLAAENLVRYYTPIERRRTLHQHEILDVASAYIRSHPADDDRTAVMLSEVEISFLVRALQLAIPQTPSLEERREFRDLILRLKNEETHG